MTVKALAVTLNQPVFTAGWYQDPATGQWYYYDEGGNRYVYIAGYIYPAHVFEPAPEVVNVAHGDDLRIYYSFKYSGPGKSVKPYGAIGGKIYPGKFDEYVAVTGDPFTLSEAEPTAPRTYSKSIDIPITTVLTAGRYYHIYVKLIDGIGFKEGETGSVALENAIFVVSAEPTFTGFKITDYEAV